MSGPAVRVAWSRGGGRHPLELLAVLIDKPPGALRLRRGPYGKPALEPDGPWFNWSHCERATVVAVSSEVEVGVDVELVRPVPRVLALAERHLPADAPALASLVPERRTEPLLAAWCRHEARLKCLGVGLTGPDTGDPVITVDLPAPTGFRAALAVRGPLAPHVWTETA
jgi:phosphopantetheinyl transferase